MNLRDTTWRLATALTRYGRRHYPRSLAAAVGKMDRAAGVQVDGGPVCPEWLARAWLTGWNDR